MNLNTVIVILLLDQFQCCVPLVLCNIVARFTHPSYSFVESGPCSLSIFRLNQNPLYHPFGFLLHFLGTFSVFCFFQPKFHGTLKPANNIDPGKDAEALRKALQGSGEFEPIRAQSYFFGFGSTCASRCEFLGTPRFLGAQRTALLRSMCFKGGLHLTLSAESSQNQKGSGNIELQVQRNQRGKQQIKHMLIQGK